MEAIVTIKGLSKRYGKINPVNRLNLSVPEGVIYGFLGPNGAGKSTTLKMLLGLVRPTAGEIALFGKPLTATCGRCCRLCGWKNTEIKR